MSHITDDSIKEKAIENMIKNMVVLRSMLHLTQNDLAQLIGISRQTFTAIENRKRKMTWNVFLSLMFVFSQHKQTCELLEIFDIYSDDLKSIYKNEDNV